MWPAAGASQHHLGFEVIMFDLTNLNEKLNPAFVL